MFSEDCMGLKTRHLLRLSGGKDSSALAVLAVYMRDRVPEMEYFFTDTGKELPETYDFLDRLEAFLGKPIARLNVERDFDHWLTLHGGLLPSSQVRWCTVKLKIRTFEEYVGEDKAYNYVAIRADEDRVGYKPLKTTSLQNILPSIHSKTMASPKKAFTESLRSADSVCLTITCGAHVPSATSASSNANPNRWDS